ncbi:MAG: ABC transporter ATP-binding protein [Myxococcales bacterium]|nr:ABC transporter ATP-binding protein [Myxococcales bacterium]MCB9708999.1 ABC transporter ATP-binding protein [Myxococcales bacterium]
MSGIDAKEPPSIEFSQLSKSYAQVAALQRITLRIPAGIWGLLGPNGSGKSTLLKLAAGQLKPSTGSLRVLGESPFANPSVLRHIGFCPEADALYGELSGLEFVEILARLSGLSSGEAHSRALALLSALGLKDAQHRKTRTYSRGMRQRVKLAQAMLHRPKVLLLDEPLTGTDPTSRHLILDAVREHAEEGGVVLFSTHVLHEVENLTDRVLLLVKGQLIAEGNIQDIRLLLDEYPHKIHIRCAKPRALARMLAEATSIAAISFPSEDSLVIDTHEPDVTYAALNQELVLKDYGFHSMTRPDADLHTLFRYLVQRGEHSMGARVARGQISRDPAASPSKEVAS